MRTPFLVLTLTLATGAALAQDSVRLNSPLPEPGQAVVQTQLKRPGEPADLRNGPGSAPATAAPAAPASPADARPMIPSAAGSAPSGSTPPAATTTLPPAAASSSLVPGQPAKVYTTLAQAKADGIDPLGEMKAIAPPPAPEAPPVGFDWRTPASWPEWARQHPREAGMYGGGALAALVLLALSMRRRGASEA